MFSKHFILNEQTLAIIEKFGEQMPNVNGHEAARRIRAVIGTTQSGFPSWPCPPTPSPTISRTAKTPG